MNIIEWRDALLESNLNYKAKLIGLVLAQFYRPKNATYPSIRILSQLSGLTVNPVQDGIEELIKSGFVKREKLRQSGNKFLSNIYTFGNVTSDVHVSRSDTSDDTSHDTSDDTSHDVSQSDMEIEEIEEKEEEREKLTKNFKNLKLEGEFETSGKEAGLSGKLLQKCWQKWKIKKAANPPEDLLESWRIWALNEYQDNSRPVAIQSMTENDLLMQKLGIANWERKKGLFVDFGKRRWLENWEAKNGAVTWNSFDEWKKLQVGT